MDVQLKRKGEMHFEATASAHTIELDGSPQFGGVDAGMRPMELFLAALAGCSSMDVVHILKRSRCEVTSFSVEVKGERADVFPAVFTDIHLHYKISGEVTEKKVARAVHLAVDKQCSVREMIRGNVEVTHSFEIV